jgi:autotransporter passenger strand-loop-strand repeat protein
MSDVNYQNVSAGQAFDVAAPTSAYDTSIYGGYQFVYGGGFADGTTVYGGTEYVGSGGIDEYSVVSSRFGVSRSRTFITRRTRRAQRSWRRVWWLAFSARA